MKIQNTPNELDLDRLGRHFSAQLTLATPGLPHEISERLRVARLRALAERKPQLQSRLVSTAQVNHNGTLTASPDEGLNLWSILASALPLLALVLGLLAIQWVQQDNFTSEIAAIDSALLTDELPPDAYADTGFVQFLKQGLQAGAAHD
ncbi:hypothetical protein B9Z51_13790 [Limnohabitans sp. T6-5]|uniref:DUF3619 family protein n=1 Tax=Limnohabitans sp. T6-5 TaxID=1100724 RepID=UPI000D3523FE|nr:DUF3619 family protein [Limnohabitans sp. T6-5]PUE06974.1 hypothetical protein B9Z51_13790 [Limnohabitans sp. T6-5]